MKDSILAIFVKSIGFSPVKTRLAQTLGKSRAEMFYALSVASHKELAEEARRKDPALDVIWARAEESDVIGERWRDFPTIYTGGGSLGEQVGRVYTQLKQKYQQVLISVSDVPQLPLSELSRAIDLLRKGQVSFVVIGSHDGGHNLVGGRIFVDEDAWHIVHSSSTTREELICRLSRYGGVSLVSMYHDIDRLEDLIELKRELTIREYDLLPAQKHLLSWLSSQKLSEQ